MTVLTYAYIGDTVEVGQPLGCDPTGWPYRVEAVEHLDGKTRVTVEPWPIPTHDATVEDRAAYNAAMNHARDRLAGVIR